MQTSHNQIRAGHSALPGNIVSDDAMNRSLGFTFPQFAHKPSRLNLARRSSLRAASAASSCGVLLLALSFLVTLPNGTVSNQPCLRLNRIE